nr:hypothetical protein [Pseudomonas sichuanensis]
MHFLHLPPIHIPTLFGGLDPGQLRIGRDQCINGLADRLLVNLPEVDALVRGRSGYPMGTTPLPVARRRQAGLLLCADACLMFAGQSHENGQVMRIETINAQGSTIPTQVVHYTFFHKTAGGNLQPLLSASTCTLTSRTAHFFLAIEARLYTIIASTKYSGFPQLQSAL